MLSATASDGNEKISRTSDIREGQREPSCKIRPVAKTDFEGVMEIENACFPGSLAYSRAQMHYLLFKANSATFVEESNGRIVGYVTATFRSNSRVAGIETIGVSPDSRGKGVGKRLLATAERHMTRKGATRARLEVSAGNAEAISMYSRAGYTVKSELPDYYMYEHQGTRRALRMEKPLPGGIH